MNAIDSGDESRSTIIVFCSDQGLAMGSHGLRGKQNMYEHTIGVPLMLVGPGIPAGKSFSGQAYLRDLFPTLIELAELPAVKCDGVSQVPVLRGERESMHDFVVGYFRDSQRMIRGNRWKWIDYPLAGRSQLFDLQNDPLELHDVSLQPGNVEVVQRLSVSLGSGCLSTEQPPVTRRVEPIAFGALLFGTAQPSMLVW